MTANPPEAVRLLTSLATRIGQNVRSASCRGLRTLVAGLCRLAIVFVLLEPTADALLSKSVEGKSHQISQEFIREREETIASPRGIILKLGDVQTRAAVRIRDGALACNALSRSSAHVLKNGLRAPLTC